MDRFDPLDALPAVAVGIAVDEPRRTAVLDGKRLPVEIDGENGFGQPIEGERAGVPVVDRRHQREPTVVVRVHEGQ